MKRTASIERDRVTRIHATVGWMLAQLRRDPELLSCLDVKGRTLAETIAELEKLPPGDLLGCGAENCGVKECPDYAV